MRECPDRFRDDRKIAAVKALEVKVIDPLAVHPLNEFCHLRLLSS